uniref:Uncharacterized protein n=1 Tax=Panagrolaimus sp. JU765 TaxID=591449 RepID=A0AC34RJL6_9BILA
MRTLTVFEMCRFVLFALLCCWLLVSIEAAPYANFPVNHPDLYLRFRKNSPNSQDSVQPFIRFRKSLPLRLRILERQPDFNPYPTDDTILF